MFYIVLICEGLLWELITLCLPIPLVPVMYPWGLGHDKVGIRALAQFMHSGYNGLFSVTAAVIRFHHVFDKSSLFRILRYR